jgi:hypothetical protein
MKWNIQLSWITILYCIINLLFIWNQSTLGGG